MTSHDSCVCVMFSMRYIAVNVRNCSKDESLLQSVKISNLNNIGCKVFTNYACESE